MRSGKWVEVSRNAFNNVINERLLEGEVIRSSGPLITGFYEKNREEFDGPLAKIEWPYFDWPKRHFILDWFLNEK